MAVNQDAKFLFNNFAQYPATVFSSNVAVTLPLANMKFPQRRLAAQFTGVTNIQVGFDFGSPTPVNAVAWVGTNLRNGANIGIWRNTVNTATSATTVTNVTQVNPGNVIGGNVLENVNFYLFDPPQTYRYWWLVFTDTGNPDGYIRLGVPFFGAYYEVAGANFNDSIQVGIQDDTRVEYTVGGTPHSDTRPPARTLRVDFTGLTNPAVWNASLFRSLMHFGLSRDFFFIPFPLATGFEQNMLALYGRFNGLPTIGGDGPAAWAAQGISMRESL